MQQQQPHSHHDLIHNINIDAHDANGIILNYDDDLVIYNHVDNYDEILENLKIEDIEPIKIKIKCAKKRICKKKEQGEPVRIPAFADHDVFMQHDYKVQELKDMCKHHGLKCGGTKQELKQRIHTHLIQSHFITRIQRLVRRSFCKMHARISGPAYHDRALCVNDTDFYSMEHVRDIPRNQFISVKDDAGVVYGFDMISLNTYYASELNSGNVKHGMPLTNPYNRMPLPLTIRIQMHRKICLTRILGVNCAIEAEPEPVMSAQQQDEQLLFLAFQQINSHGHYADSVWFSELNMAQTMRFMRELADIWNYRAQIIPQLKQEICPPNGDPFRYIDLRYMPHDTIKHEGIQIINAFVTSGNTRDSRGLGAYYVLSALTLVSQSAQAAMPWLYESVVHFT
jgi:hypothetical protein